MKSLPAAELIYPEAAFADDLQAMGISGGRCTPEAIVRLKRNTRTTLSYAGLVKRAEFLGFAAPGALEGVKWRVLEESIFGPPLYKQILLDAAHIDTGKTFSSLLLLSSPSVVSGQIEVDSGNGWSEDQRHEICRLTVGHSTLPSALHDPFSCVPAVC